jgi:hypothetical protein
LFPFSIQADVSSNSPSPFPLPKRERGTKAKNEHKTYAGNYAVFDDE